MVNVDLKNQPFKLNKGWFSIVSWIHHLMKAFKLTVGSGVADVKYRPVIGPVVTAQLALKLRHNFF